MSKPKPLKVPQVGYGPVTFRNLYKEERTLIQALENGGKAFRVMDGMKIHWHVKDAQGAYVGLFKDSSINCKPYIQQVERRGEEYRLATPEEVQSYMSQHGILTA